MKAIQGGKAKNDKVNLYKIAKLIHGGNLKAHVDNTASQYNLPAHNVELKNVYDREKYAIAFLLSLYSALLI